MELRKSGVDAQMCKETGLWRYYSTLIANAPVAWQPPATPTTTTTQVFMIDE